MALLNIQKQCPPLTKALTNTYRLNPQLFIDGEILLSREGTTQGDPLAMAIYTIATVPHQSPTATNYTGLVCRQHHCRMEAAAWTCVTGGTSLLNVVMNVATLQMLLRPGWWSNQSKQNKIFAESGVQITAEGRRHLGATLGTRSFAEAFVSNKVQEWV